MMGGEIRKLRQSFQYAVRGVMLCMHLSLIHISIGDEQNQIVFLISGIEQNSQTTVGQVGFIDLGSLFAHDSLLQGGGQILARAQFDRASQMAVSYTHLICRG